LSLLKDSPFVERLSGGGFVGFDIEHLVQLGDFEHFVDLGIDAAELELGFIFGGFLIELNQLAESRRGHETHGREIDDHAVFGRFVEGGFDIFKQPPELGGVDEPFVLNVDRVNAVFGGGLNGHGHEPAREGLIATASHGRKENAN
jgi:hypothetical protein